MRTLFLFCFLLAASPQANGQTAASPKNNRSGQNAKRRIELIVRTASISEETVPRLFPDTGVSTIPLDEAPRLPDPVDEIESQNGIRLVSARRVVETPQTVLAAMLDEKTTRSVLQAVNQDDRSNLFFAPKIVAFDGQQCELNDTIRHPWVVPTTQKEKSKVGVVSDGTHMTARATIRDGGNVRIELGARFSKLTNMTPIPATGTKKAGQLPEVEATLISLVADVSPGNSLAVRGLVRTRIGQKAVLAGLWKTQEKESDHVILIITPRVLGDPDEPK